MKRVCLYAWADSTHVFRAKARETPLQCRDQVSMIHIRQVPWLPSGTKPVGLKAYIQNIRAHPVETTDEKRQQESSG